jgi:hypothetical protein
MRPIHCISIHYREYSSCFYIFQIVNLVCAAAKYHRYPHTQQSLTRWNILLCRKNKGKWHQSAYSMQCSEPKHSEMHLLAGGKFKRAFFAGNAAKRTLDGTNNGLLRRFFQVPVRCAMA